jgi:hypothetical protein
MDGSQHSPPVVSDFEGKADLPRKELATQEILAIVSSPTHAPVQAESAGTDRIQFVYACGHLLGQASPLFWQDARLDTGEMSSHRLLA